VGDAGQKRTKQRWRVCWVSQLCDLFFFFKFVGFRW
ncbi:ABC transporter, permease domain protein, partial [Vibrio parahaemolyticus V-223/04]